MENGMTIEEIRTFCVEGLEILNWYYRVINEKNDKTYNAYISKRSNSSDFLTKIQYAFSFAFKAFMVAVDQGHFVDFETYKDFKKRKQSNQPNNFGVKYALYLMDLGNKMPQAIKNTTKLLKEDDVELLKFYKVVINNIECTDVVKPFIMGILESDAELPFSKNDWDLFFDVSKNVVSKDMDDFNFNTRFRNLFEEHKNKINQNNSISKKR